MRQGWSVSLLHDELGRGVPAGLVEDEDGVSPRIDGSADLAAPRGPSVL